MKRSVLAVVAMVAMAFIPAVAMAEGGKISGTVAGVKKLQDFVVYVDGSPEPGPAPAAAIQVDQKNMQFIPHVLPVLKGTKVEFLNSDPVRHNVFSPDHEKFNLGTWPTGETRSYTFDKNLGAYTVLCNVHPEMEGFVVVLPTRFSAVTDKSGAFTIEGVPDGEYAIKTWHEKYEPATGHATVKEGAAEPVSLGVGK